MSDRVWDDEMDLWEHQGHRLTVRDLIEALARVDGDLPVAVAVYEGTGRPPMLSPTEVGFVGDGATPDAIVITATRM